MSNGEKKHNARMHMGIFRISEDLILQYPIPEGLEKLFSQVVVTRCEYMAHNRTFQYIGFSPMFKELKEGEILPEYFWHIQQKEDAVGEYRIVKVFPEETSNSGLFTHRAEIL